MKIQFLNGGLANQAFQYIFARYYELSHPGEIMYMDDSYFALNTVHNGYELEKVFGLKPHLLSECFSKEEWDMILEERRNGKSIPQIFHENNTNFYMLAETPNYNSFNPFTGTVFQLKPNEYVPGIQDVPGDAYYHGYWINKGWFDRYRDIFLKEFQFPELTDPKNLKYLEQINNTNSAALHVRRGDFIKLDWALSIEECRYLVQQFIKNEIEKWDLFVFSDDLTWCKENASELGFDAFEHVTYVEGNVQGKNYIDMQLMSSCKGMIMSTSSFCYLSALLNTKKAAWINPTRREV